MTDFTAPRTGRYAKPMSEAFRDLPEGSTTIVEFDTIAWQTIPPRTWTHLDGDAGTEIYHEEPGALRIMSRRTPEARGWTVVTEPPTAMNSGGALKTEDLNATEIQWDYPETKAP